ncbi:hypothetical protein CVT25_010204 [Psilocybe cyanescens]|uniref:Endonuclease/exonuclease/phosphatase domain-containing protein n=1 Tax=Psilocybe cyanescens TaxID=93625 RepID=A0A409XCV1_PSICY|nr:hypothetical protein CVT25_010204 [Psilocybe cyanescens]
MATPAKIYQMTPEQLALAKLRKAKKERLAQMGTSASVEMSGTSMSPLLSRPWLPIPHTRLESQNTRFHQTKIMSWNVCNVLLASPDFRAGPRTELELFPNSDCLKVGQREPLIHEEIRRQNADILCLQEVDRLEKLLPMLEKAGYSHCYASGPRKLHGCLIAFKKDLYSMVSERVIFYDDQTMGTNPTSTLTGGSFKTRNIGYMLALKSNVDPQDGIVVATTHLFWHPRYIYEKIRQVGILLREVTAFREELSINNWPTIIAGDFNFTPIDPAYSLVTGDTLLSVQKETITSSRVVHSSIDPSVVTNTPIAAVEDEAGDVDPDRVIVNARPPRPEEGILTIPEIEKWFSTLPKPHSAYNIGIHASRESGNNLPTFGARNALPSGRNGSNEPEYTSYTHYWHLTLDYIFFLDLPERPISVIGLLTPLKESDMTPGLPLKHVSGSDHTCLVAELSW